MPIVIVLVVVILTIFIRSVREVQGFKYLCKIMNIVVGNGGVNEELEGIKELV
jgi:ethanolamine transporter EutH